MALLAVQSVTRAGVVPTLNAVSASDTFANDGRTIAYITNGGAGSITATFVTPGTTDGLAIADLAVTIANGATKAVGPFPKTLYNDSATGLVTATFSGTTSVTMALLSIGA